MRGRVIAVAACALIALSACGTGETPTVQEPTPASGGSMSKGPSVTITMPTPDSGVAPGDVEVAVAPKGFRIVNKLGQDPVPGEGHVHYYLDVDEIPTTPGKPAVTEEGTYHAEATTHYTWPDVEAGEHTFGVQLVNNNHTPLEPPVTAEVKIMVGGELPAG